MQFKVTAYSLVKKADAVAKKTHVHKDFKKLSESNNLRDKVKMFYEEISEEKQKMSELKRKLQIN